MKWVLRTALLAAVLLPASCAEDEADTAFDLELTPDTNLGSAQRLAAQIDTVLLVVDSPQGLYPASEPQVVGNVQIKNVDSDAWLELVVTVPVPSGRLPWIRLRRGALPDEKPLDLRLSGLRTTGGSIGAVALGRVQHLQFTEGVTRRVVVPFNVRPERLAPRVLQVLHTGGARVDGCRVEQLAIVFSKPMDAASLQEAGAIVVTSDAGAVTTHALRLDPDGLIAVFEPDNLEHPDTTDLSYHVFVATSVHEPEDGLGLDQFPGQADAQPFDADFVVPCDTPVIPVNICGSGALDSTCPGDGRLDCVADVCLPRPVSCEDDCPGGWTCALASGICEVDCTLYGGADVCPSNRPYCDDDSGVCVRTPG
jgi:hypothetical protein